MTDTALVNLIFFMVPLLIVIPLGWALNVRRPVRLGIETALVLWLGVVASMSLTADGGASTLVVGGVGLITLFFARLAWRNRPGKRRA